jgi:hypothetical protein
MRLACTVLLAALLVGPADAAERAVPPSNATLLARHAPVLVLHPAETFAPVPVDGFLADAELQRRTAAGWEAVGGRLPVGGAALRLDQRLCHAVEGIAAAPCYAQAQAARGSSAVAYAAAFRTRTRIVLQYWLWYPFNGYSPTLPAGDVWQAHEGDWEAVSVLLDHEARPLEVAFSRHCAGARREWRRAPRRALRPLVYVALGSHANYFRPGTYPHERRCWPRELRDVVRALALVDRTGPGREVRPRLVSVTARTPAWMRFAGTWGEDGYVHFPNNDPIAYAGSPRGPAFHAQWRRPLGEPRSWPPA